jgi:hypothetical protein
LLTYFTRALYWSGVIAKGGGAERGKGKIRLGDRAQACSGG